MFGTVMVTIIKLKPFGFPIHASIDGWSRKILWLYVTRSNNLLQNIVAYYLEAHTLHTKHITLGEITLMLMLTTCCKTRTGLDL